MAHTNTDQFTSTTTAANKTFTLTKSYAVGEYVFGFLGRTSSGSLNTITSVTDSKSNTWVIPGTNGTEVNSGTTVQVQIFWAKITTALVANDTVTINTSGTQQGRWALSLEGYDDVAATTPFDVKATSTGTSNSVGTGTTGTTAQANELVVAVGGFNAARTANIPSGWSGSAQVSTAGGTNDRAIQVIWKYVTATGTESASIGLDASGVWAGTIATFKQATFAGSTFAPGNTTTNDSTTATAWSITLKPPGSSGGGAPPPPSSSSILWGATPDQYNQTDARLRTFETQILRRAPHVRWYLQNFTQGWFTGTSELAKVGADHTVVLSINTNSVDTWANIANGSQDTNIKARIQEGITYGKPFYLCFHHEPENDQGTGRSAADYANMWRHLVTLCRNQGLTNATFAWIMIGFNNSQDTSFWSTAYPGNSYVDWVGFDPYCGIGGGGPDDTKDTGLTPSYGITLPLRNNLDTFVQWSNGISVTDAVTNGTTTVTSQTASFNSSLLVGRSITGTNIPAGTTVSAVAPSGDVTKVTLSQAASGSGSGGTLTIPGYTDGKPVLFGELGIDEGTTVNGVSKAAQFPKVTNYLKANPIVQMVLYYNGGSSSTNHAAHDCWWVDSTPTALTAFQTWASDAYFMPGDGTATGGGTNNQTGTLTVAATATPTFRGGSSALSGTLTVSAVASPFFVGSGSGGGATSTSNWPVTKVEAQFGGVWTDITAYVARTPDSTLAGLDRGREFELDTVEATTVSFALDNRDGRFDPTNTSSPYYPNVTVLCPVRWTNQWNGVAYSTFTGYVERWPQAWEQTGLFGVSDPLATDALALLAQQKLIAAWVGQAKANGATSIYPLTEDSTATQVADMLGFGPAGILRQKNGGTAALGGTPAGNGLGNLTLTPDGHVSFAQPLITSATFTLEMVFNAQPTSSGYYLFGQGGTGDFRGDSSPTDRLVVQVILSGSGNLHLAVFNPNDVNQSAYWDMFSPSQAYQFGTWAHLVCGLRSDRKTPFLQLNGTVPAASIAVATTAIDNPPTSDWHPPTTFGWATGQGGSGLDGSLGAVALYVGADLSTAQMASAYQSYLGFPGQRTDQRAATIIGQAGWAGATLFDPGYGTMGTADFADKTVLSLLQDVAAVEGTSLYVDGGGVLTIHNRATLQNPVSQFTFGENSGEIHYTDIRYDNDPTYLYNEVVVNRPGGGSVSAKVTTSYPGTRTYDLTLDCGSDAEALSTAQHYLAMYKDLHERVSTLTFNSTTLKDYTAALSLDIGDFVTVNRRQPGRAVKSGLFSVQHISHDIQSGVWTTTLQLAPADTTKYLILDSNVSGYRLDEGALSW